MTKNYHKKLNAHNVNKIYVSASALEIVLYVLIVQQNLIRKVYVQIVVLNSNKISQDLNKSTNNAVTKDAKTEVRLSKFSHSTLNMALKYVLGVSKSSSLNSIVLDFLTHFALQYSNRVENITVSPIRRYNKS